MTPCRRHRLPPMPAPEALLRPVPEAALRPMPEAPPPRIGHNGGPPLDPEETGRLHLWRRASKRAWTVPREVALSRLVRAESLGMSYREYTLEILERGRHL